MEGEATPPTQDAASDPEREGIEKIALISYDDAPPSNVQDAESQKAFSESGAIDPPYSVEQLGLLARQSNVLHQCIDTMSTNCEKFGYRLSPIIDLNAADADAKIAEAIHLERVYEASKDGKEATIEKPSKEDVKRRREEIEREMPKEHAACSMFFNYCTDDYSFIELRDRTRTDLESIGDAYWEVIRNGLYHVAELTHVVATTVRKRAKGQPIKVPVRIRISPIAYGIVEKWRRFRTYVQICEGTKVYFKEFGDRRVLSAKTGKFYVDAADRKGNVDKMKEDEGEDAREATELWNLSLYSPSGGAYGLPRWFGNILSVEGSHKAEKVNYLYFDNKAIPPMVVMVEGGVLAKEAVSELRELVKKLRGAENFHKILLLEAKPAEGATGTTADGKVRIKLQPLTDAILKDGMFMAYDAKNRDKVAESFRLPKLLRGDSSEVNRATAEAALAFAEQQVFSGERNWFDYRIDRTLLTDMEVKYHEFESLGPDLKNPEALATAVKNLEGVITTNEARLVASDILGRSYKPVDEWWGNLPVLMALAQLKLGAETPAPDEAENDGVTKLAKRLIAIRKAMVEAESAGACEEFKATKHATEEEPLVIPLEAGSLDKFVDRS